MPVDKVTACCFGGEDGRSLYVTTASVDLEREQPLAGCVFVTEVDVSGPPAQPFRRLTRSCRVGEEDGAFGGRADESAIAREDAAGVAQRRRLPVGEALGELGLVDVDGAARRRCRSQVIAVPDDGEQAATRAASGATWPTMRPRVAPEKRPSVTSATDSPNPAPTTEAVTLSSSRIPGPAQAPRTGRRARRRRPRAPTAPPRCRPPRCRTRARARCASGARCRRA